MFVKARIRLLFSAVVAFCTAVVVVVIGKYICESYLLFIIASLAFSNFVAIITEFIMLQKTTSREDDSIYTFGFVRAGLIGTVVNQIFLFGLFFNVLVESLQTFVKLSVANGTILPPGDIDGSDDTTTTETSHHSEHKEEEDDPKLVGYQVLFVSIGALVVQVFIILLYHLHGYIWHKFSCSNSLGPQAEALIADPYFNINPWSKFLRHWQNHHISVDYSMRSDHAVQVPKTGHPLYNKAWLRTFVLDVSGSFFACIVAICSSFVLLYGSHLPLYHLADPALSIVVIIVVVGTRGSILKDTMLILLQTLPRGVSTDALAKRIVNEVEGILSIHELHVWQLTSKRLVATVHITVARSLDYMKIASAVKHIFHSEGIHSLTMQPEFIELYPEIGPSDGLCLVDCSAKSEEDNNLQDCVTHQCCQEPVVVFPDPAALKTGDKTNGGSFARRSLLNPPDGITMIDASVPSTPFVVRNNENTTSEQAIAGNESVVNKTTDVKVSNEE